jgi:1-acyl-sn-glycerol-3-phosphate acyltransferase
VKLFQKTLYLVIWSFSRAAYALLGRVKIKGARNIPRGTGVIIASNHMSLNDPPLIGSSVPWPIYYMGKKELFEIPVLGWVLRQINVFPVNREGSDAGAIRRAVKLLREGKTLLIFPKGTRTTDEKEMFSFKSGVGALACMAQVPVVPCLVRNTGKLKKLARLSVSFAEPVFPPEKHDRESCRVLTGTIAEKMKALR